MHRENPGCNQETGALIILNKGPGGQNVPGASSYILYILSRFVCVCVAPHMVQKEEFSAS